MIRALPLLALALLCVSCRQDMHDQPKYKPLAASTFFPDGRSARPIPAHTVALSQLNDTDTIHTGEKSGDFADTIPIPVTLPMLKRGQERFDIFCSPCHGRSGDGNGMVAQRGFHFPADLASDRVRQLPPGYIFQVITNGYGGMGDYGDQIPDANDRWAIVAYVRALQLSRGASVSDVPAQDKARLGTQ